VLLLLPDGTTVLRFKGHIRKTSDSHFKMLCFITYCKVLGLTRPVQAELKPTTSDYDTVGEILWLDTITALTFPRCFNAVI
jgi:hypothetical protein